MLNYLKFLPVVILLNSLQVSAKGEVILISDIDDTIKVSHVMDLDSAVANALALNNSFMGMSVLYQSLLNEKQVDKFVYLSSAPNLAMKRIHQKFLNKTGFPSGALMLSKSLSNRNHKITALRKVIQDDEPKELILIGDNGERDTSIYAQIKEEFPQLPITTYIHQAYSLIGYENNIGKPLEKDQTGFATSIDLAATLKSKGDLSQEAYNSIVENTVPEALKEDSFIKRGKPMMFPAWFDCRDYGLTPLPAITTDVHELVAKFEKRLSERCTREPYDN